MTKRMLIDSTHAEETRVVVLDGNRLEDYDVETSTKQQLKGNIYLAKIVRVEPSLQAAFVEFGGGRHGFLAFGEIHPDYYQLPVADRKRLVEMQEAEAREDEEAEEAAARAAPASAPADLPPPSNIEEVRAGDAAPEEVETKAVADAADAIPADDEAMPLPVPVAQPASIVQDILVAPEEAAALFSTEASDAGADMAPELAGETSAAEDTPAGTHMDAPAAEAPEQLGGEHDTEERQERRSTPRFLRNYKIQEVIRRRQILLVQVVKEERGTKGAALTTYISLAGRFSVLMPNSPRGGGISRKITSAADRRRLKEVTTELDLPRGMGLIVRTAGANRPKPEIMRDCEYLLNQWDQIRGLTMKSMAPALIYEEASLIKRAIRDVYSRDVDDILVDGEAGWRAARDFMRMLMPTHARKVQLWKDPQPLFAKAQVETQLDAMLQPTVQLRSGGYLVINQTEALVAIDVNSGRSTRERGIEETALRTNMEAAEEAARQLRLRDLAGLIVIDFIDMESRRNNAAVEKKLKDALKNDRARIQIGSISHFGLLEMSRQRLRPSIAETSLVVCPHCDGAGHVRSTESAALHVLRAIEEEGSKRRAAEIVVHVAGSVALYVLNHKRVRLGEIEQRYGMHVAFAADETLLPPQTRIERLRALAVSELPVPISQLAPPEPFEDPDEETEAETTAEEAEDDEAPRPGETAEEGEQRQRKRRRRRRGSRREEGSEVPETARISEDQPAPAETPAETPADTEPSEAAAPAAEPLADGETDAAGEDRNRRRGRRGGRRRRREPGDGSDATPDSSPDAAETEMDASPADAAPAYVAPAYVAPVYAGPTPADPFGGAHAFDIFDAIEQAEQERAAAPSVPVAAPRAAIEPEPAEAQAPPEMPAEPTPEPAAPTAVLTEDVPAAPDVPKLPAPEPVMNEAAPEPGTPEPQTDPEPPPAPVIQPILIGASDVVAEKKRGWWRR